MERTVLDKDIKYIDAKGNLLRSRMELSISKLLLFLGHDYDYNARVVLKDGSFVNIDFKISSRYIEVIDSLDDAKKFQRVRQDIPELDIVAVGNASNAAKMQEINSLFFFNETDLSMGSIFIEDPSLAFDYAHILPLVEKCSILHGHTSTVMVEIIGSMKNNLVIDFGEAKRLVKDALGMMDHKFFINKRYLEKEDAMHYYVSFDGPKGYFNLQLPKETTFLLSGEATVENLASEILRLLAPKMPPNVEALGIYIYEGVNKGAHIISKIDQN